MTQYYFIHQQEWNSTVETLTGQTVKDWAKFAGSIRVGYDMVREKNISVKKLQIQKLAKDFPQDHNYQPKFFELSGLQNGVTLQVISVSAKDQKDLQAGYLVNVKNPGHACKKNRQALHQFLAAEATSKFTSSQLMAARDEALLAVSAYADNPPPPAYQHIVPSSNRQLFCFEPIPNRIIVYDDLQQERFRQFSEKLYGQELADDMPEEEAEKKTNTGSHRRRHAVEELQNIRRVELNKKRNPDKKMVKRSPKRDKLHIFDKLPQQTPTYIEIDVASQRRRKPKLDARDRMGDILAAAYLHQADPAKEDQPFYLSEVINTITSDKVDQNLYRAIMSKMLKETDFFCKTEEGLLILQKVPSLVVDNLPDIVSDFHGVTQAFREEALALSGKLAPAAPPENVLVIQ